MERIDEELQARVWQRVQGGKTPSPPPQPPCRMRALARELQGCYHVLALRRGGGFRHLEGQLRDTIARLWTLEQLSGCREPEVGGKPVRGGVKELLEKCCHLERRLAEAMEQRRGDDQWGAMYGLMAAQARQRCMTVLKFRGNL